MGIEKLAKGFFDKELSKQRSTSSCQHCNNSNTVEITVYQRYASNLGIPFYPVRRHCLSNCSHCKQQLDINQMNEAQKKQAEFMLSNTKTPLSMWSGLIGVGIFILIMILVSIVNQKQ